LIGPNYWWSYYSSVVGHEGELGGANAPKVHILEYALDRFLFSYNLPQSRKSHGSTAVSRRKVFKLASVLRPLKRKNYCKYSFIVTKIYLFTQIQTFLRQH